MTNAELQARARYLQGQLAYFDGETPLSTADRDMIREKNACLRELRARGVPA